MLRGGKTGSDPNLSADAVCAHVVDEGEEELDGAFHVLEGSSIHSHFEFEKSESISAHLRVGQLRMTSTQLLETGSTVPIACGAWPVTAR